MCGRESGDKIGNDVNDNSGWATEFIKVQAVMIWGIVNSWAK